tara:strand:- start:1804 stop:2745 length:942 start_codon:yes stop_codon:yes gene_type:complete
MPSKRPNVIRKGLGEKADKALSSALPGLKAQSLGVGGDRSAEAVPQFIQANSENVLTNGQNSWIVLGRDRPAGLLSGKGGEGQTQSAAIDMVVGRLSASPIAKTPQGEDIFVDPDFRRDAARIYMSQKTDIDTNFGLEKYAAGSGNLANRSAIGVKADVLRFVAREGIKIVSGVDVVNSQNARINELRGIDLMVYGHDSVLQPLVKGGNLSECLSSLSMEVDKLAAVVKGLLVSQMKLNKAFIEHWHTSPFFLQPTTPSHVAQVVGINTMVDHLSVTMTDIDRVRLSIRDWEERYVNDLRSSSYICSRHNNTT